MRKLARSPQAARGRREDAPAGARGPSSKLDRVNRTYICSVLVLDIVDYAKKPVAEQLSTKEQLTTRLSDALSGIAANDRIVLDTGDGLAVNFLGNAEDALFVALHLLQGLASARPQEPAMEIRIGLNLGPVRLVRGVNGEPSLIGDGINVAERVMSFGAAGRMLLSRAYYGTLKAGSEEYVPLFAYQGSRTDKNVREHEIYEIAAPTAQVLDLAERRRQARARGPSATGVAEREHPAAKDEPRRWLVSGVVAYAAAAGSLIALIAAVFSHIGESSVKTTSIAARPQNIDRAEARAPSPPPAVVATAPPAVTEAPAAPATTSPAPRPEASPARPTTSEPAQTPRHGSASRKDAAKQKPPRATAKAAKPKSRTLETKVTRAEAKPAPPAPAAAQPPQKAAPTEPATTANTKPAAGPTALIMLAVSPWGEVVVDGKSMGVAPPLSELELAPGRYRIEIRNSSFKPYLEIFDLEPNQTIRIKHKFKQG